ncbi:VPS4-associated protein 1 [Naematelia encephala]|uniref:VPS4-associated protein 1 n=1 Tax=Naematelia encephala TaxID=71784 RepID=A0A1Y2AMB9_9TREE|nr:VPS4-associated protein 1 [Naematelia encephala]
MTSPASTPLQNIYYERKTGTARSCYVCRRPTQTVLATLKTEDFLYTCDGHLSDPGFASPIVSTPAVPSPSAEDIKKVVSEYQARTATKSSDLKSKTEDKDKDKDKDTASPTPKSPTPFPTATPSAPTHRKFALHRQIFEMRKADIRRKEQGAKAKEVSKGLPQVPRGAF